MKLLVIRGDLQSHSGYSGAARDFCRLFQGLFDRVVGVDIHFSSERPYERFPYSLVAEAEARGLAAGADFALVLSFTTPDCYARYPGAVNVGLTFWETDRLPLQGQERSPWVAQANAMDALWAPSSHTKAVFEAAGVTVPIRVVPWPIRTPGPTPAGLPDGTVYDLDRQPWFGDTLLAAARFKANRWPWSRRLMERLRPKAAAVLLGRLRSAPRAVVNPAERALLCVAQDVPRKGLLLFLSEWLEFKRRREAAPWTLILKTTPIDPRTPSFDFVTRFWRHVQNLRRQLGVARAGVYLWTGDLSGPDFERLLRNCYGCIAPSLGEGFCGPAALALALGKPLVAPRHTAFADYVPEGHRYAFETRQVILSIVNDPLRVYDPASTWGVPEAGALARALGRLAGDTQAERDAVCRRAQEHVAQWCGPERVREVLAEEVERLASRAARRAAA
jgi:glycosyltransferase involved in cell wall biosynthesis